MSKSYLVVTVSVTAITDVWDAASEAAGFDDIQVDVMKPYAFRFRARKTNPGRSNC